MVDYVCEDCIHECIARILKLADSTPANNIQICTIYKENNNEICGYERGCKNIAKYSVRLA
jgi:hypothetical protein